MNISPTALMGRDLDRRNFLTIPVMCLVGAAKTVEDLPILEFRTVRPIEGGRPQDRYYGARVNGSSLIDEGIFDGDLVVVRASVEQHEIRPSRLTAVLTPYGLLIKHLYAGLNGRVRLVSANPLYEDIVLDASECQVQGVVVRVERDL